MASRLDSLLVSRNLISSREKAKELILSGKVHVNNNICKKPSQQVDENADIKITGEVLKYVGRGGLKLEKAIEFFKINLENKVCADIGASTGGFTDCMIQNGAQKVYAVDVGHDQLAEKLKNDSRVVNLEGVNVRYLTPEQMPQKLDFISVDVSFISLTLVLPVLKNFLSEKGEMVCLIKPQFEAGKSQVGKKGVVKSQAIHVEVIKNIIDFAVSLGFNVCGLTFSPIKGPEGNIEYLIYLKINDENLNIDIKSFIVSAFNSLKNI